MQVELVKFVTVAQTISHIHKMRLQKKGAICKIEPEFEGMAKKKVSPQ